MNMLKTNGLLALVMTGWCASAQAIPYLQLDISPGTYVTGSADTVATSNPFTLYGLIDTSGNGTDGNGNNNKVTFDQNDDFFISIAILGLQTGQTSFGSFEFGGISFNSLSSQFKFGAPPDPTGDLAKHGIYNTWFTEVLFNLPANLDPINVLEYNVQTDPGDPVFNTSGTLAAISALVDISNLNAGLTLHFDFYTTKLEQIPGTGTPNKPAEFRVAIDQFAPFSHDATSCIAGDTNCGGDDLPPERIPEPSAVALLGIGLLGMGLARKGRRQVA
ncbi:choice-of-anchor N protein [Methylomonas montana]|uniref:choice-of-anchor N protein n=1 Tax=Methylomonas montana TaxID=3058963 RepID=UPI002657D20C|nr:choice-of-anchor N protein [Methylomonas montana]WKJ89434.1 choice-of-anchor N protein [Methylomonas montana]